MIKMCRKCRVVLSLDNCCPSKFSSGNCLCRTCHNLSSKESRRRNTQFYRDKSNEYNAKSRIKLITEYGGRCVCCGENTFEFLTIDHINNDGAEHRKKVKNVAAWLKRKGYPKDNFQLLCMNCNFAKAKYGQCPHTKIDLIAMIKEDKGLC